MTRRSIGALLRSEREIRDLSIQEVSSTTRIPRRTLECLEDDRFEDLPSGVFVRGFIKAYASAVDIDAREVLARFDEQQPKSAMTPPLAGIRRDRSYVWLLAITIAALFAIIVATFVMVRRAPAQNEAIELSSAEPCQVEPERVEPCSYGPSTTATPIASSHC